MTPGRPPRSVRLRLAIPAAAACTLLFALPGAAAGAGAARAAPIAEHRPVCIRGACFEAEIAATEAERAQGLMYRDTLPPDRGMLFVFPDEGRHQFWMKNTRIALDMIFIGADRRVVGITHRAQPCRREPCETYGPPGDSAYVLEIGGGLAESKGIAAGDLVTFPEPSSGR